MELRAPGKKDKYLPPIVHSASTEAKYRQALEKAVVNMTASYEWWLAAKYRAALEGNQEAGRLPDPEHAQDAGVEKSLKQRTDDLFRELSRLRSYWAKYFDDLSKKLADQATQQWYEDNARSWEGKLRRAGFDIKMQLTPAQRLILQAKVPENVSLIRSIQQDYHKDVEGIVLRNFVKGRDLSAMAEKIKERGGVTTRRAALIARDQSNKATAQMNAARQAELGLTQAQWIHSSAGKEPREKHVKAGRERLVFDTQVGVDFHDGFGPVLPGEAINCFPGESEIDFTAGCVRLWRRRYRGQLTEVITSSGETFRATPNHPILTRRGWVAAGALNLRDHVVRVGKQIGQRVEMHVEQSVTRIEDYFSAVATYIPPICTPGATAQFHGDGAAGYVDVVDIDSFLPSHLDAARCQELAEFIFADPDAMIYTASLCSDRALAQALTRMTVAPERVISCASALLPFLKSGMPRTDDAGLRLVTWLYAVIDEALADDGPRYAVPLAEFQLTDARAVGHPDLLVGQLLNVLARAARLWQGNTADAEELADSLRAEADERGHFADTVPEFQQYDRVVNLRFIDFEGHVYNLENARNWYAVSAYIVHNCRCTSRTIIPALGRGLADVMQDVTKTRLPGQPVRYS